MRGTQGRPGRCCVWSARPSRPSGAAPVPFRTNFRCSFSDFWLENDFLFWPFDRSYYLTPPFSLLLIQNRNLVMFVTGSKKFSVIFRKSELKHNINNWWKLTNNFVHPIYYFSPPLVKFSSVSKLFQGFFIKDPAPLGPTELNPVKSRNCHLSHRPTAPQSSGRSEPRARRGESIMMTRTTTMTSVCHDSQISE